MKPPAPDFSVVVAAYGRTELLEILLRSLNRSRSDCSASVELIVVDSTPAPELQRIRDACERAGATFIKGPVSVRRKRNLGSSLAKGRWLLFVDSDCEVSQGIFSAYLLAIDSEPMLAVAAGPTVFRGDENRFTQLIKSSSLLSPFHQPAAHGSLLWATTSNLLVKKESFQAVGGFREDFPFRLGGDDTDLCLRLRDRGLSVTAVPNAVTFHSWASWRSVSSVVRRSFRWGWVHSRLLRDHERYRRIDAPGLPVHALACTVIAMVGAVAGRPRLLLLPGLFVAFAVVLHALFVAVRAEKRLFAFMEDLALALVELPFGFGKVAGSLANGSFAGLFLRLDGDDAEMDRGFAETVRCLWSDHIAFLLMAFFIGWVPK